MSDDETVVAVAPLATDDSSDASSEASEASTATPEPAEAPRTDEPAEADAAPVATPADEEAEDAPPTATADAEPAAAESDVGAGLGPEVEEEGEDEPADAEPEAPRRHTPSMRSIPEVQAVEHGASNVPTPPPLPPQGYRVGDNREHMGVRSVASILNFKKLEKELFVKARDMEMKRTKRVGGSASSSPLTSPVTSPLTSPRGEAGGEPARRKHRRNKSQQMHQLQRFDSAFGSFRKDSSTLIDDPEQRARVLAQLLRDPVNGVEISDHTRDGTEYVKCFVGSEAVTWLVERDEAFDRVEAVNLAKLLLVHGYFDPIGMAPAGQQQRTVTTTFEDSADALYRFPQDDPARNVSINSKLDPEMQQRAQKLTDMLRNPSSGINVVISDRRHFVRLYERVFVGEEFVSELVSRGVCVNRAEAVSLGQLLLDALLVNAVTDTGAFRDGFSFYRFREDERGRAKHHISDERREKLDKMVVKMRHEEVGVGIEDRTRMFKKYDRAFLGRDAVDWMVRMGEAKDEFEAVRLGEMLMDASIIHHVTDEYDFRDADILYRFREDERAIVINQLYAYISEAEEQKREIDLFLAKYGSDGLQRAEELSKAMRSQTRGFYGQYVSNRKVFTRRYYKVFEGVAVIEWLLRHGRAFSRSNARKLGQMLLDAKLIFCVSRSSSEFLDDQLYHFAEDDPQGRRKELEPREKRLAEELVEKMRAVQGGLSIGDRKQLLRVYPRCIAGSEMVDWLIESGYVRDRAQGVEYGQLLVDANLCHHVSEKLNFLDEWTFYRFRVDEPRYVHLQEFTDLCTISKNELEEFVKRFSAENSVSLTPDEFRTLFELKSPHFTNGIFAGFDKDASGSIDLLEFLSALAVLLKTGHSPDKVSFAFHLFDANGSGVITKNELRAMLVGAMVENGVQLSTQVFQEVLHQVFEEFDFDASGSLDFSEFEDVMMKEKRSERMTLLRRKICSAQEIFENSKALTMARKKGNWTESRISRKLRMLDSPEGTRYYMQEDTDDEHRVGWGWRGMVKRARKYVDTEGNKFVTILTYVMANVFVFLFNLVDISENEPARETVGAAGAFLRGTINVLNFNLILVLIFVSKGFLTWVRTLRLAHMFPWDKALLFHRYVAYVITGTSVVHIIAAFVTMVNVANADGCDPALPDECDQGGLKVPGMEDGDLPSVASQAANWATTTGIIATVCLTIIMATSIRYVRGGRAQHFERFWWTHHTFVPLYVVLLMHGAEAWYGEPRFVLWFLIPGAVYLVERAMREWRTRRAHKGGLVRRAFMRPGHLLDIEFKRPKGFRFTSGQHVYLKCPEISKREWHPFALTSSPGDPDTISVTVRGCGDWTEQLITTFAKARIEQAARDVEMGRGGGGDGGDDSMVDHLGGHHHGDHEKIITNAPTLFVDGPFASPLENMGNFNYLVLIGHGMGFAPFASFLRDYMLKRSQHVRMNYKRIYVFWMVEQQEEFEMFRALLQDLLHTEAGSVVRVFPFLVTALPKDDVRSFFLWHGIQKNFKRHHVDPVSQLATVAHWGCPDYDGVFRWLKNEHPRTRFGVFFSGPRRLSKQLGHTCRLHTETTNTRFSYHHESWVDETDDTPLYVPLAKVKSLDV